MSKLIPQPIPAEETGTKKKSQQEIWDELMRKWAEHRKCGKCRKCGRLGY